MARSNFMAVGLACMILFAGVAIAEDAAKDEPAAAAEGSKAQPTARRHILTDIPDSSEDVDIAHIFPDYPSAVFPAGERLKVIMGLRNTGESLMNVTHIAGSINAPNQWSYYITNFTVFEYNVGVESSKESSFEYQFMIDPQLAGHEFTLALTAFYHDGQEMYASTFFNTTIPVIDPPGVLDTQTLFMYLALLGMLAAAVHFGLQSTGMMGKITKSTRASSKKEMGTAGVNGADEWLQGTAWTTFGAAKKRPAAKKAAAKK